MVICGEILRNLRPQISHLGISWDAYDRITNPGVRIWWTFDEIFCSKSDGFVRFFFLSFGMYPHLKMHFLLNMRIFHYQVSFRGVLIQKCLD